MLPSVFHRRHANPSPKRTDETGGIANSDRIASFGDARVSLQQEPNESTLGPSLDDQYTAAVFYRIPMTQHVAITPSVEYIKDQALNPKHDSIWIAGIRVRIAL